MKIENIDVEKFLKEDSFTLNREHSLELSKNNPSIKRKHVKKPKKVTEALEELETMHNWSWYEEVKNRNKNNMDKPMVYYRGNEKTGYEVFEEADQLANSFRACGLNKGDEVIACMANVPEFLTVLLAASKCGLIVKPIGEDFDKEFLKTIFKTCNKKIFIGTDDKYSKISDIVRDAHFEHKVIVSLADSLPNGIDPFTEYDNLFYTFEDKVLTYKKEDSTIESFKEFLQYGKNYRGSFPKVGIDDDFTETFTSGSTKIGWPKTIVHKNRHYIAIARFHDPDLSRMPAMRNMRGLAHIPTHSNTNIASSISDTLCQTCTVAFEPIYNKDFLAYSLQINEPGFAPATRSHILNTMRQYEENPMLKGKKLSKLLNFVAVGEDIAKNEEIYVNKCLKKLEAGSQVLPKPLSPITLSVGGGNCEHGGLFFTLFKSMREKLSFSKSLREDYGLTPFQLSDVTVLHEDGTECEFEEIGNLVANSPLTMKEYQNNPQETEKFHVTDNYGRTWGNCNVWSYIAKNGNVVMKGRKDSYLELSSGKQIPNFLIAETVLEDEENVLSCEVVTVKDEEVGDIAVAHFQLQPDAIKTKQDVIIETESRFRERFSPELAARVVYRERRKYEDYTLTKSGKRSIPALENEGITDFCLKPTSDLEENKIIPATQYIKLNHEKYVPADKLFVYTKTKA